MKPSCLTHVVDGVQVHLRLTSANFIDSDNFGMDGVYRFSGNTEEEVLTLAFHQGSAVSLKYRMSAYASCGATHWLIASMTWLWLFAHYSGMKIAVGFP